MTTNQATDSKPSEREELILRVRQIAGLIRGSTDSIINNADAIQLEKAASLLAADGKAGGEVVAWADKAMELATDFAVESLRVGDYEARNRLIGNEKWKLSMLREKRETARDRLRHYLYIRPQPAAQVAQPLTELLAAADDVCRTLEHPAQSVNAIQMWRLRDALAANGIGKDQAS